VVVVQGTDTIEETAFLFDLLWSGAAPLVVTGAMRNPTVPGADGAANLLAAISVAAGAEFRDQGALVVLDDEVHAARYVGKWHTTATGAFVSANGGPLGRVDEGRPRRYTRVDRVPSWPLPPALDHRVPLIVSVLGDDGLLLDTLAADPARVDGVVLAGLGGGHVPGWLADRVGGLAARVPVVLTSRTGAGPVLTRTYAATGAEIDLIGRGVLPGGLLDPFKARLLLLVTLACGLDRAGIAAAISAYG
jgi:L-asparaginase